MHPEISLFPNCSFYNNYLLNADMVSSQHRIPPVLLQLPQPLSWMRHYAFVDVPHTLDAERKGVNHSVINQKEAEVVCQLVGCLKYLYGGSSSALRADVCIIAMYKEQVNCIQQLLRSHGHCDGSHNKGGPSHFPLHLHTHSHPLISLLCFVFSRKWW